jgi:hypothetical protein
MPVSAPLDRVLAVGATRRTGRHVKDASNMPFDAEPSQVKRDLAASQPTS